MKVCEDLRQAVLQAAIQGKLTKQLPEDGDAKELLAEIRAEKERLIKEGKLKKSKALPEISEEEIPFDIPENWQWVRIFDLGANIDIPFADGPFGSNLKSEHYTLRREVRIVQLSNIGEFGWKNQNIKYTTFEHLETIKRSEVHAGDIVIAKMMPAGRAIIIPNIEKSFVLSSDAVKFVPHHKLNKNYLYNAINSSVFKNQVYSEVHGITRVRTSLRKIISYIIPLPPLAEQERIVAKVDALLSQIDDLEKTEAALDKLKAEFPADMKASLLQAAIQGKLTEQLAEDGTAADLLAEIKAEKEKLIKEGKLKKSKALPEITEEEIPFDIPENWQWVRLGTISTVVTKGTTPRGGNVSYLDSGIGFLRAENISGITKLDLTNMKYVSEEAHHKELKRSILQENDLLITIAGTLGRTALVLKKDLPLNTNQAVSIVRLVNTSKINLYYLIYVINAPSIQERMVNQKKITAIPNLTLEIIENSLIALPPLAEQKRIVAKLEKLLPLCDGLVEK